MRSWTSITQYFIIPLSKLSKTQKTEWNRAVPSKTKLGQLGKTDWYRLVLSSPSSVNSVPSSACGWVWSTDKSLRRMCWKVETMTVMSNSKSELSISFFHILHTNIVLEILKNCLTLWKKLLRKSTSLQAGPASSLSGGQCQNLVVPSKVLYKLIPHVIFISYCKTWQLTWGDDTKGPNSWSIFGVLLRQGIPSFFLLIPRGCIW